MSDQAAKIAQLRALLNTPGVMSGESFRTRVAEVDAQRVEGEFEVDRVIPGERIGDESDGFYLVRQDFPFEYEHGVTPLGAALSANARQIAVSAADDELHAFDPRTAIFVDTETTGLMGGTGTVLFLVGVGYFTETSFRLDQCFMRDYDDEEPMLAFLDDLFSRAETLVSYNGKTFDLPLLRTRFITNRVPFRLERAMHFDLVHAARRLWRKRLRDCSLGNVEERVMGIRRHGDVDSSLIPQLWMNYLRTRDARPLEPVFYHHRMDILSLVALTGLLSQKLETPAGRGFEHHEDRLSLLRMHFKKKRFEDALELAAQLTDELEDEQLLAECLEFTARAAKKTQDWDRMETAWRRLADLMPYRCDARNELAKFYEHARRDLLAAERECVNALQYLQTRLELGRIVDPADRAMFERRLTRIQKKLRRGEMFDEGDAV